MNLLRVAWRAWWQSVVASALFAGGFATVAQAMTGRWSRLLHNVVDVTAGWTLAFAAVASAVAVPFFLILSRAGVGLFRRPLAMALGAVLGATAVVAFSMAFHEGDASRTVVELIQRVGARPSMLGRLAVGAIPFAAPGLVFGDIWAVQASPGPKGPKLQQTCTTSRRETPPRADSRPPQPTVDRR